MDQPTLRQLRYFAAVADELHFGRAAERVGIAQPPLTQQIQKLERSLGCQLLVRSRKTRLTEAGISLASDARRLLSNADQAFETAKRIARGELGQLRLGVPPSVMLSELPSAIRRFRKLYPSVMFSLRELATSAIEEALLAREVDLGFLREARPQAPIRSEPFLREALIAVLPAAHPFAKAGALTVKRLKSEPFILFPRRLGPAFHDRIVGACLEAGFTPNLAQEATQWQTIVAFVEAGMGVSIAPQCVNKLRRPGVVFRSLLNTETTVYASWNEEDNSPAAAHFIGIATGFVRNRRASR